MVSSIQEGLCVLVGIKREDTAEDVEYIGHFPFQQPSAPPHPCLASYQMNLHPAWPLTYVRHTHAHTNKGRKILGLRLFEDGGKPWAKSVTTGGHSILCVSQFTLYAKVNKGNKPDFHLVREKKQENKKARNERT